MFQQLVQGFMQSRQGQTAFSRLQAQGFSQQQAHGFLGAAVPTAAQAFHQARSGGMAASRPGGPQGLMDVGNSHYVTNFLSGAVSGLIRGQGMMGAAVDGVQGVAGGHVAQVIASRFGLPQRVAGTVGAIVTPLVIDWLFERVGGGGLDLASLFGGGPQAAMGGAPQAAAPGGGVAGMMSGLMGGGGAPSATVPGGIAGVMGGLMGGGGGGSGWGGGGATAPAPQPQGGGGWGASPGAPSGTASPVSPTVQGGLQGGLGALFGQFMGGGNNR